MSLSCANVIVQGFYESYAQQQPAGFGGRNVLGHDDVKGLPGGQQQSPASAGIPPGVVQQQNAQGGGQPATPGGQGPQQYAPPVPYYFPYAQQGYYGAPFNAGYNLAQPYVKYPGLFQPGEAAAVE